MVAAITLWGTVLNLLILVAVFAAAVAVMLYMSVHQLSHAKVRASSPEEAENQGTLPNKAKTWAEANKFRFLGYYEMGSTRITAWQHSLKPTLFCQYATRLRTACDFVTVFADGISLTTGNTPDSQILPRAFGKYGQSYPNAGLDELWQRHTDMEIYLAQQGGVRPGQIDQSLEDTMNKAMLEQLAHVHSMPLWPIRAVWWYFVRQYQWQGLSIMDQRQLSWVRLPNEPANVTTGPVRT